MLLVLSTAGGGSVAAQAAAECGLGNGQKATGTPIKLGTLRNGQPKILNVTLGELPNTPARAESRQQPSDRPNAPSEEASLGLSLAPARKVAGAGSQGVVVCEPSGTGARRSRGTRVVGGLRRRSLGMRARGKEEEGVIA